VWQSGFSRVFYPARAANDHMFCRLEDFRRIAIRFDKLATNFMAAVCLAPAVTYRYRSER